MAVNFATFLTSVVIRIIDLVETCGAKWKSDS